MIEAEFLNKLQNFQLALKKNSSELKKGEQLSNLSGHGMIFKDHKQYAPGDDIRRIDWTAYARTNEFFVKRFDEEKNATVHILADRSSSMDFGEVNKYEFGAKIGLGIAYMTNKTNDRFKYSVFSETLTDLTSARRNGNMMNLLETLNDLRKTPESQIGNCVVDYSRRIKNESVVLIISDFLTDIEQIRTSLESLEHAEVILVNVLDQEELEPSIQGDTILKDPESDSKVRTYVSSQTKSDYKSQLEAHIEEIEEECRKHGAEYILTSTGDNFFDSFLEIWDYVNQ